MGGRPVLASKLPGAPHQQAKPVGLVDHGSRRQSGRAAGRRRVTSPLANPSTPHPPTQPPPPPGQVTELFSGYVGAMLAEYAASPAASWKAKDCALYLVTALTVRGKTAAAGATTTNTLVNLQVGGHAGGPGCAADEACAGTGGWLAGRVKLPWARRRPHAGCLMHAVERYAPRCPRPAPPPPGAACRTFSRSRWPPSWRRQTPTSGPSSRQTRSSLSPPSAHR